MRRCLAFLIFLAIHSSLAVAFFVPSARATDATISSLSLSAVRRLSGRANQPSAQHYQWKKRLFVRGGHESPIPSQSQQMSTTIQDESATPKSNNSNSRSWVSYITAKFIQLLFKGMTLPFPMLRELGNVEGDNAQAMLGFSLQECLLAIVSYLCLGTISYSFLFEKWPLIDSLYFSVVTFTSVGYGDLTPSTLAGKFFTCFFGLSGLAFLGAAISTIGSSLNKKQEELIKKAEEASRKRIKDIMEGMPHVVKSLTPVQEEHNTTIASEATEPQAMPDLNTDNEDAQVLGWRATAQKTGLSLVPALSFLWFGGMIMARMEGWKLADSIYYSIITGSTIGFGDLFPKTRMGRAWGIIFIPLAVAAAGDVLGNVASSLVERRQAKVFNEIINREITMESLLEMDDDGNGKVSREEYVQFMLMEMGLVEPEEFDELYAQFKRLDANGNGYLDKKDLHLVAKHRQALSSSSSNAS